MKKIIFCILTLFSFQSVFASSDDESSKIKIEDAGHNTHKKENPKLCKKRKRDDSDEGDQKASKKSKIVKVEREADSNNCCHFCRVSANRPMKGNLIRGQKIPYIKCIKCQQSWCSYCLENYKVEGPDKNGCKVCKKKCCCSYVECPRKHSHDKCCFTKRRTLLRHAKSGKLKWTKKLKEASDSDSESESDIKQEIKQEESSSSSTSSSDSESSESSSSAESSEKRVESEESSEEEKKPIPDWIRHTPRKVKKISYAELSSSGEDSSEDDSEDSSEDDSEDSEESEFSCLSSSDESEKGVDDDKEMVVENLEDRELHLELDIDLANALSQDNGLANEEPVSLPLTPLNFRLSINVGIDILFDANRRFGMRRPLFGTVSSSCLSTSTRF